MKRLHLVGWFVGVVACGATLGWSAPSTSPTSRPKTGPTTQPVAEAPATKPARDNPLAAAVAKLEATVSKAVKGEEASPKDLAEEGTFSLERVTPAQLLREMKAEAEAKRAMPLVAQIDLSSPLQEQPTGFSLFGGGGGMDLRTVLGRLEQARKDEECKAVLLTFYNGGLMNFAQAEEIRRELRRLKRAGKRTFVYADTYDTTSYLVASGATDVCLMEGGEVFIPGVAIEPMFYRGTLDKLGIKPDYIQVGEYKGAEEPYTRTQPSDELTAEMESLVEAMYGQIIRQIAGGRRLSEEKVKNLIDRAMVPSKEALHNGLVDHLSDADGLRDLMSEELGKEVRVDSEYGLDDQPEFDAENPFALLAMMAPPEPTTTEPSIALIYAEGVITGGEGGEDGPFGGGGIGSERIRRAMRMAERDENIKAVVIRIDSPGGSALASEAMYQAVRRVAEEKPVIISIGGMAASGGYYLACAGDTIIADPSAIVGSIGVVGGKLVLDGLYEKLGVTTTLFTRGRNADIFSDTRAWDERQEKLIRAWMESTYEQFTSRVMESRGTKIADIEEVARGRIFLARDAKALGLVDELGGIELAMRRAAGAGSLDADYGVIVLPGEQADLFGGGLSLPFGETTGAGVVRVELGAEAATLLRLMPPHLRDALSRMVRLNELLMDRPVVLITPFQLRIQ